MTPSRGQRRKLRSHRQSKRGEKWRVLRFRRRHALADEQRSPGGVNRTGDLLTRFRLRFAIEESASGGLSGFDDFQDVHFRSKKK